MIAYCAKCESESVPHVRIAFHRVPAFAKSHAAVPKFAFLLSAYCRKCKAWMTNLAQDDSVIADLTGSWLMPDPSDVSVVEAFAEETPVPTPPADMPEKLRQLEAHGWERHDDVWMMGRYRIHVSVLEKLRLAELVHSLKNPATTWPLN